MQNNHPHLLAMSSDTMKYAIQRYCRVIFSENIRLFTTFGGIIGDISTNPGAQPYKFGGKEYEHYGEIDLYDFGARLYNPALCVWISTDPLAEKYYGTSHHAYCFNSPVKHADVDGRLVIFINGMHAGDGGKSKYWGGLDKKIMDKLGDHKSMYYDGSIGGMYNIMAKVLWFGSSSVLPDNINPYSRMAAGRVRGYKDAANIFNNLSEGETIKIFTHSMGAAYSKGYIKGLQKYAKKHGIDMTNLISYEVDLAPFQPDLQKAADGVTTIVIAHAYDWIAGKEEMEGADNYVERENVVNPKGSYEHSITSFTVKEIFDILNKYKSR